MSTQIQHVEWHRELDGFEYEFTFADGTVKALTVGLHAIVDFGHDWVNRKFAAALDVDLADIEFLKLTNVAGFRSGVSWVDGEQGITTMNCRE